MISAKNHSLFCCPSFPSPTAAVQIQQPPNGLCQLADFLLRWTQMLSVDFIHLHHHIQSIYREYD
jgi:hypothetical protein